MFRRVNEAAIPYADSDAQQLKNTSLHQIVGIFCIAILVKGELFSDDYFLSIASVVLLTWNIAAYICVAALTYFSSKWFQSYQTSNAPSGEVALTDKPVSQSADIEKAVTDTGREVDVVHTSTRNPLSEDRRVVEMPK